MEFKFGSCKVELRIQIIGILLCLIILMIAIAEGFEIKMPILIILFFVFYYNVFRRRLIIMSITLNKKNIKLKTCQYFGFIERTEFFCYSDLYFTKKIELSDRRVATIVRVYDKETNKRLFEILDNSKDKKDIEKIAELMLEHGVPSSRPNLIMRMRKRIKKNNSHL